MLLKFHSTQFLQHNELFGHSIYDVPTVDSLTYYLADTAMDSDAESIVSDKAEVFQWLPVGEEGMYHSHAGKEAEMQARVRLTYD
jgi:hypothetical protein